MGSEVYEGDGATRWMSSEEADPERLRALGQTQLRATHCESPAPDLVRSLGSLEHALRHGPSTFEWRTNFFVDLPLHANATGSKGAAQGPMGKLFDDPGTLASHFAPASFRRPESSKKRRTTTDNTDTTVQSFSARVCVLRSSSFRASLRNSRRLSSIRCLVSATESASAPTLRFGGP